MKPDGWNSEGEEGGKRIQQADLRLFRRGATKQLPSVAPYEKIRAWRASHEVALAVYRATENWPRRETYGLTAQARRAGFSVAANIAEGSAKRGQREFRRYLNIALGSSNELRYVLHFARDLGYLEPEGWSNLESSRDSAGKLLWRLYEAIGKRSPT